MSNMGAKRLFMTIAWLLLAIAIASAQSLADVARREEERRKTIKKPAKIYTNDDLRRIAGPGVTVTVDIKSTPAPEAPAPAAAAPVTTPAAQAPPANAAAVAQAAAAKDEASWKGRMSDARLQLERNKGYADAMQSRINALTADFSARDDPAQRAVLGADRIKALAELDRLKKEIVADTKRIADIQEEARRAGVLPGWVR